MNIIWTFKASIFTSIHRICTNPSSEAFVLPLAITSKIYIVQSFWLVTCAIAVDAINHERRCSARSFTTHCPGCKLVCSGSCFIHTGAWSDVSQRAIKGTKQLALSHSNGIRTGRNKRVCIFRILSNYRMGVSFAINAINICDFFDIKFYIRTYLRNP